MASGKSSLALELAKACGFVVLHTDDFIYGDDEAKSYVERLDLPRLKKRLNQPSARSSVTLIEGICLRQVASQASIQVSLFIYVKRISETGVWHDGVHLEDFEAGIEANGDEPELSHMVYHANVRPHEIACFEIQWAESNNAA